MSGLKLFELGNLDITTGGTSLSLAGMNTIGVSEITNSNSVTINSGASIFLDTNGPDTMVITPGGSVGIGLSNPDTNLHFLQQFDDNTSLDEAASIKFSTTNGTDIWDVGEITSYIKANNGSNSNYPGGIAIKTKSPSVTADGVSITTKMVIDSNGSVGIGTTNPSQKLDIIGGGMRCGYDTDNPSYFGRSAITALWTDHACFSHIDHANQTNAALYQDPDGVTYLNSASGQNLNLRRGG